MARNIITETGETVDVELLTARLVGLSDRYTSLIAYTAGGLVEYIGYALPGTAITALKWQIRKLTYSGNNVISIQFADSTAKFDKRWDKRADGTYTYG